MKTYIFLHPTLQAFFKNFKHLHHAAFLFPLMAMVMLGCMKTENTQQYKVVGVKNPEISLNGTWEFTLHPTAEPAEIIHGSVNRKEVEVPGELAMQGFPIKHDSSYMYTKTIHIPEDYRNKIIKLRFDGVYSYAKVWVNGHYIRSHNGGFTRWECDITSVVEPGEQAMLVMKIQDRKNDLSYGSGYAKHQIGGILRDVSLRALPKVHFRNFYYETELDERYEDATLSLFYDLSETADVTIGIDLLDTAMNKMGIYPDDFSPGTQPIKLILEDPAKWTAENPNLYTLRVSLKKEGKIIHMFTEKIGFREIEMQGNEMLVNGQPVKLRGACRHDMHPTLGRMTTSELDRRDVLLAKEANMNYIRTSHYPPSEAFLDYCDQYGIYTEVEAPVCFVNTYRTPDYDSIRHSGPDFQATMLNQLKEMVKQHRNHPSVVIWSTGNENHYDQNFQASYNWLKNEDSTRPIKFSFPGTVPDSVRCYDILSMHYPSYKGSRTEYGITVNNFECDKMPVIFDEWAHVPSYNKPTLQRELNIRNFWGITLDSMWTKLFRADGGLGGAIWGYIDETFSLPLNQKGFGEWWGINHENNNPLDYVGPTVGYGEWGIVDVWRRKKPEFWSVKKAYSPVRLLKTEINDFERGVKLELPVWNRFDHTNLNEITVEYTYQGQTETITGPDIQPHERGMVRLKPYEWANGEDLKVAFYDHQHRMIDRYLLKLGKNEKPDSEEHLSGKSNLKVSEKNSTLIITTADLKYSLDKSKGMINYVASSNDTIIKGGPHVVLKTEGEKMLAFSVDTTKSYEAGWKTDNVDVVRTNDSVKIRADKYLQDIHCQYTMHITQSGIEVDYSFIHIPDERIRELGMKIAVSSEFSNLKWEREGYWSVYPPGHMNTLVGETSLRSNIDQIYREKPRKRWCRDVKSYYYKGLDHPSYSYRIAREIFSFKENIKSYVLSNQDKGISLEIAKASMPSCRLSQEDAKHMELYVVHLLDYPDLGWRNYERRFKTGTYSGAFSVYLNNR